MLSNHWLSNNSISFKGVYAKTTKYDTSLFSSRMFTWPIHPESKWFQVDPHTQEYFHHNYTHHLLFQKPAYYFLYLTPLRHNFFPTSYPITENEFGLTEWLRECNTVSGQIFVHRILGKLFFCLIQGYARLDMVDWGKGRLGLVRFCWFTLVKTSIHRFVMQRNVLELWTPILRISNNCVKVGNVP